MYSVQSFFGGDVYYKYELHSHDYQDQVVPVYVVIRWLVKWMTTKKCFFLYESVIVDKIR